MIHFLAGGAERLHEFVPGGVERLRIFSLEGFLGAFHGFVEPFLRALGDLVTPFGRILLDLIDERVELVTCVDVRPALFVLSGVRLGVLDHLLDLAVAQAARRLDTDLLLLARGVVLGLHV